MKTQPDAASGQGRGTALANLAWLLGDKAFALVAGLSIFGLIARTQGPAVSGHFAYAAALLQIGLGLSLVCAGVALLPRFCRLQGAMPAAIANVFVLRLAASLLAMLLTMAFCVLTIDDPQRRNVALILLCAVPLIEPFYVIATYWLSRNHNRPTVIARSSGLLVRGLLVAAGVLLGAPVWSLALAWVVEAAVNAMLQTLQLRARFAGVQWTTLVRPRRMGSYLRFGLRFVAALWLSQLFLRLDRLVLAERLSPEAFGLYAAPMQLVEVWSQVAYLIGTSLATAYLFQRLRGPRPMRALFTTAAAMAAVGLLGLGVAWLVGPWLLGAVFGAAFIASEPVFVAGAAFAVLLFADQAIDLTMTANRQGGLLALKWAVAVVLALLSFEAGFPLLGPMVGPAGLAVGIVGGWMTLLAAVLLGRRSHRLTPGLREAA